MAYTIFDLECDGLLDEVTKLHCFCYQIYEKGILLEKGALVNPNDIITFLDKQETLIGHNILRFDLPVLKKLLGWKKPKELKIIDTMGLSWYLYIGRKSHGLESFGEEFGVPKPKISDWSNLTIEEYIHRCSEDVEINQRLFHNQIIFLHKLYSKQEDKERIINYLNFKMDCLREQEEVKIKVDTKLLYKSLDELETIYNEKVEILKGIMPKVYKYKEVTKPNKMTKKDGSLSEAGKKWLAILQEQELPEDYEGIVTLICEEEEPNPGSVDQVKKWFYSLGWIPCTYKTVKDKKKGTKKEVEQIYDDNGKICNSVKKLIEIVPEIELFNDLSLITHRIGVFKSFMESMDKNNCVYATAGGLSNTFRFLHRKPISNLPKPNTFYGKEIRGLILSPKENTILCGSDLSAAEATTQDNYMYKFDPDYVNKKRVPGYDAHIEIAKFSGLMSEKQANRYKELDKKEEKNEDEKKEFLELKTMRNKAKIVNFCLPTDITEILTTEGWKKYEQLKLDDCIFSYNTELNELEVVKIDSIPYFEKQEVISLHNSHFSFECTPNHKWFSSKKITSKNKETYYKNVFVETKDINKNDKIIVSAPYKNTNRDYNVEDIRLLAWILTEGYVEWSDKLNGTSNSNGKKRHVICKIGQKSNKEDLEKVLNNYKYRTYTRKDGLTYYDLSPSEIRSLFYRLNLPERNKKDIDYTNLIINIPHDIREEFIIHMLKGDGHKKEGQKIFTQNKGKILDAFCLALTLNGYFYKLSKGKVYKNNVCVDVFIRNRRNITGQKLKKDFSRYTDVFCVNNKNKTFIAKQNDLVVITGNSSVYKVGAPTLAKNLDCTKEEAETILDGYWTMNKSVLDVEKDLLLKVIHKTGEVKVYKTVDFLPKDNSKKEKKRCQKLQNSFLQTVNTMYILNPVSNFWISLRYFKDIFSSLNQSTAVFVFDCYLQEVRKRVNTVMLQIHDEYLCYFNNNISKDSILKYLKECISKVNDKIKFSIPMDISADFGVNYAECH